jgi:hypothetical protein
MDGPSFREEGQVVRTGGDWRGPTDLDGQVYFAWDERALYVALDVSDDVHHQPFQSGSLWKGDSVQLGLAAGMPGETDAYQEYAVALTKTGPKMYRRSNIGGGPKLVEPARVAITRNEERNTTQYELAIPWDDLDEIQHGDEVFSLSVLVNDKDGDGRKGWVEWGQGIGSGKNPAAYQPMTIVDQHRQKQSGSNETGSPQSPTSGRTPGLGVLIALLGVVLSSIALSIRSV